MAEPHLSSPNVESPVAEPARTLPRFRDEATAGEAGDPSVGPTTEPLVPSPNGAKPAPGPLVSLAQRKDKLARILEKKVEQGYEIESQTETGAILVTKARRRWFGLFGTPAAERQSTSIDEYGRTKTRSA